MTKELLIGCGSSREKRIATPDTKEWKNLVTLDIEPRHKPDLVWDLMNLPLPFAENEFTEIHAYEVLEHLGAQGDYKTFFAQFSEFWRILAPGGSFVGSCPMWNSKWAWGDPSHTRIIPKEQFTFLDQSEYARQVGRTAMSDFRDIYKADFQLAWVEETEHTLSFVLTVVKPSRHQAI